MRSLFISNVLPWPLDAGDKIRCYHMLRAVARVSKVTLVSFLYTDGERQHAAALSDLVEEVHTIPRATCRYNRLAHHSWPVRTVLNLLPYLNPVRPARFSTWQSPDMDRLLATLAQDHFDIVWGQWLASVPLLERFPESRRVLNLNDVEHRKIGHRLRQVPGYRQVVVDAMEYVTLRHFERSLPRSGWDVLVCSEDDRQALGGGSRVCVVPNGVTLPSPPVPAPIDNGRASLLFVGELTYEPNVDAVQFFVRDILPGIRRVIPGVTLSIVGRNPSPQVSALHDGATVQVVGPVPSVRPYIENADVVVVPIRFGGGTRIKILEAMGHRRPVVSTTVGAEGLNVENGRDLMIADDPVQFAAACTELLRRPDLRVRLGEAGHATVAAHYLWEQSAERVEHLLLTGAAAADIPLPATHFRRTP